MKKPERAAGPASQNRRRRLTIVAVIIVCLIAASLATCSILKGSDWLDPNAKEGSYEGKTQEQIVADLNAQVAEGMMNISISSTLRFPNGTDNPGSARIENIAANHVDQKVTIVLDGTGEAVYQSKAIAPGHSIDNITLSSSLPAGGYDATAIFTGYDPETHEEAGILSAQVRIIVG